MCCVGVQPRCWLIQEQHLGFGDECNTYICALCLRTRSRCFIVDAVSCHAGCTATRGEILGFCI